jgi:hypothetical protein
LSFFGVVLVTEASVGNFFKCRIIQADLLLALMATVAAFAGSANEKDQGSATLGGTWGG